MTFPIWWENKSHVPNHQPASVFGDNVIHPYELGYDLTPIDPYNVYNYKIL